jgi:5-methylcytosine-specific restriction endonuclease McrA
MTINKGRWTQGRFNSFVTSALRGAFRRWPPKFDVLKNAFTGKKVNKKSGKLAAHYLCAECNKEYVAADVQVDHIAPVVDVATGFVSWDVFITRLFCEEDNLQVLCKPCHKMKSAAERAAKKGAKPPTTKTKPPKRKPTTSRPSRSSRS